MTPLTSAGKTERSPALFLELKSAIQTSHSSTTAKYKHPAPRTADGWRQSVNSSEKSHDKLLRVGQLEIFLSEDI